MTNIFLNNESSEQSEQAQQNTSGQTEAISSEEATQNVEAKKETVRPNLFLGRTDAEPATAKFPDWDILPPSQFINPRIKIQ